VSSVKLQSERGCRQAYKDILVGFSIVNFKDQQIYVKHFKEDDIGEIEERAKKIEEEAASMGLVPEKEYLEFLKEEGHWTQEDEDRYLNAKQAVDDTVAHMKKIVIPDQIKEFKKILEEKNKELAEVYKERNQLVGVSLEKYIDKKSNENYILYALYKDKEFKELFFSPEEFEEMDQNELASLIEVYNEKMVTYREDNIKRIAVNSFFLNPFFISEGDPVKFFGRPVLELTVYQMNLYSRGKYYKSIIQEGKTPPEHYYNDEHEGIEKLVNWYDNTFNIMQQEAKNAEEQAKANSNARSTGGRSRRPRPRRVRRR